MHRDHPGAVEKPKQYELEERRKNAVNKEFMHEKEEKKKLEKRIAMLCICMCMMIITAVCSKFSVLTTLQSTDTNEQSCRHDAINQSVRNTNNTHKFTHSTSCCSK